MTPDDFLRMARARWSAVPSGAGPIVHVEVDWKAYFEAFREAHGKFPLYYRGKLLFPDGWSYSATDYAGPEWPPPEDPVAAKNLRRMYWRLRRNAVRQEIPPARLQIEQIKQLIATHSVVPLKRVTYWDREGGKDGAGTYVSEVRPVSLDDALARLAWLEDDLALCELKIVDPDAPVSERGELQNDPRVTEENHVHASTQTSLPRPRTGAGQGGGAPV